MLIFFTDMIMVLVVAKMAVQEKIPFLGSRVQSKNKQLLH